MMTRAASNCREKRHAHFHLERWVEGHGNLFRFTPPRSGGMAFLSYNLDIKSDLLVERLRLEKSTLIVPGDCFGMDHWVRIGIGVEAEVLKGGLERFDALLAELQ